MLREVEIRHLLALRAVAETGSFGRAAHLLGYSQSAVSQQIASFERLVDGPLFDRPGGPRPVELTPLGRLLLEHAVAVLERLDAADAELARYRAGTLGRLVVGTFQSVSVEVLPTVVGRLRAERPELDIRLFESDDNQELLDRVAEGELDLTFVVGAAPDGLEAHELCRDPFVVVVPRDHALAASRPVPVAALCGQPLIGQQPSSCQTLIDQELAAHGVPARYVFRSNDNAAVQAMVRAGMGLAVMPSLAVTLDDPDVVVAGLEPPFEPRVISLVRRAGRTSSPAAERFAEIARDVCRELGRRHSTIGRRRSRVAVG